MAGRTLSDVGVGAGGGGFFLNAAAKREVYDAGAVFNIVDVEPFVKGTDGYDDQVVYHIQFAKGTEFDFMPEDADDDTVYKIGFGITSKRTRDADQCVKHFALYPDDPIIDAVLITGKSQTPGHSNWWGIAGIETVDEDHPAKRPVSRSGSRRSSNRSAPPARRAAPEPDDDDGI